jgi:phosphoglycolate phosphatase
MLALHCHRISFNSTNGTNHMRFSTSDLPGVVIFDLDGTLVDTGPDLTAALNHVLALAERPPVDLATVRDMVGLGARKLIERGLAHTGGEAAGQVDALFAQFLDYYGRNICIESRPYPGVEAVMDALAEAGARLGVCTNKPEAMSHALFEALGWTRRFGAVVGGDSLAVRKPDPLHYTETVARLGGAVSQSIMVGDSEPDVLVAKAAGAPVAVVTFGFSHVPAASLGADALIHHYDDALETLARLHANR